MQGVFSSLSKRNFAVTDALNSLIGNTLPDDQVGVLLQSTPEVSLLSHNLVRTTKRNRFD